MFKRVWELSIGLSLILCLVSSGLVFGQTQQGKASFYPKRATGARTASGEPLHHDSLTCAHRTLPFGTLLKVTHVENGRSVVVRVNDRGPFTRGRIIDLSWAAARELGMISQGIATVLVEQDDDITIPLRPSQHYIHIPSLMIGTSKPAEPIKPIWQGKLEIDHKKVQRHMHSTAQKSFLQRIKAHFE